MGLSRFMVSEFETTFGQTPEKVRGDNRWIWGITANSGESVDALESSIDP
jgi:hypothetical protein